MYVEVYGLGHIGVLSSLYLASQGMTVRPYDVDQSKVTALLLGQLPQQEPGLLEFIEKLDVRKNIVATRPESVAEIHYLICVGSPSLEDGSVDLSQVHAAIEQIMQNHPAEINASIILRSTVPPGTCENLQAMAHKKYPSKNFSLAYFPEFIRTGQALADLQNPSLFVYSGADEASVKLIGVFPGFMNARRLGYRACEYLKYVCNTWHALKVAFANEVAAVASGHDVQVDELFEVFLSDRTLNISEKYLRPGPPFGGPCLNKEVDALAHLAQLKEVDVPIISKINLSNESRITSFESKINLDGIKRVFIIGSGFRPGTSDIRNSVAIKVAKQLMARSNSITFYLVDSCLSPKITGAETLANLPANLKDTDVLIIGSSSLTSEELQNARSAQAKIYDLGYHAIHAENA